MRLKNFFAKSLALLALVFAGAAQAQIPVTDGAQIGVVIGNQVEQISKWAAQYAQLKQQIEQYQAQFNAITGSRGMGALLSNTAGVAFALPKEWQDIITNIKATQGYLNYRKQYPTTLDMPKVNAMYDMIASQSALTDDLYSKTNARIKQIQDLMGQIDSANDPAAKTDLTNRLVSEQNAVQANQNLLTILQTKNKQDMENASSAAEKEILCKEFKRPTC